MDEAISILKEILEKLDRLTAPKEPDQVLISASKAAKLMDVSVPKAYEMAKREDFPSFEDGKRILVIKADLPEWARRQAEKKRSG